jgi:hypothetical protein
MNPSANRREIADWFRTAKDPRELQEYIHSVSVWTSKEEYERARTAIEILLAESAESSSLRLEKHTENLIQLAQSNDTSSKRLIALTWALVFVSVALVLFAAMQTRIMLKQDAGAHSQQIQSGQGNSTSGNHQ